MTKGLFHLIDRGIGAGQTILYCGKSGKEYPFHYSREYQTHVYGPFAPEEFNRLAEDIIGAAWQNRFFPVAARIVEVPPAAVAVEPSPEGDDDGGEAKAAKRKGK